MKSLFVLAALTWGFSANAAVYRCEDPVKNLSYLLALEDQLGGNRTGLVFDNRNEYFRSLEGKVETTTAMDGGPTWVTLKPIDTTDFDGADRAKCYVNLGSMIRFKVDIDARGDQGSTIQFLPMMVKNPRKRCPMPAVRPGPPRPISCALQN